MSLTTGRGPLSTRPAGRFSASLPTPLVYVEPFQRRVRGRSDGRTVVDSERVLLVHAPGQPPTYAFPSEDVQATVASEPEPAVAGHVRVPWDAVDEWWEEEERMLGHPRNPYHRVDCLRSTRRLRVEVGDAVLVDTSDTVALYESALAPRLYVRRQQVDMGLLRPSTTTTYCPYKGAASYWSAIVGDVVVEDVAWSYEDPLPESIPISGLLSFDGSRVTVRHDLPAPTRALEDLEPQPDGPTCSNGGRC
ncbi:protein of unknown function DUF427 [Parafrankia sp. EAN1pec]|uniref:DUF427 domain-containing protein n=1 Tax=Parafrankia sp. (strain EAN1pec) TaxID=298653 RepID=UPI00005435C2|nr:protein of unknown function DUF427 [Frankia sp. EAN1pec]